MIVCINQDVLWHIHSCITPMGAFDSLVTFVAGFALIVGKFATAILAVEGAISRLTKALNKRPRYRIWFMHAFDKHPAAHPIVCEDGECKVQQF